MTGTTVISLVLFFWLLLEMTLTIKKQNNQFIRLPVNVKTDKADATFEKGILQVTLAKTEEAKKKEIKIKVKLNAIIPWVLCL